MGQARQGIGPSQADPLPRCGPPRVRDLTAPSSGSSGVIGSGKSRYAKSTGRGLLEDPYTQWWDGYGTHDTVILTTSVAIACD